MKLITIVESLILEATPEQIHATYYNDIPFNTFTRIVIADPGTKVERRRLVKIGKYAKMLLSMFRNGNLKMEDLPKAKEYLNIVYKYRVPIDINKIGNISELYQYVKIYYAKETKDLMSVLRALNPEEYQLVFNSDKWVIYNPLTDRASCYLGVDTQWCTTWGKHSLNPDHKSRESNYANYVQTEPLYIIINKQDNSEKYQFHFPTKQYMDRNDSRIDSGEFLDKNPGIRNFFFPSLVSNKIDERFRQQQIDRMDALSSEDSIILMRKLLSINKKSNPLALALLSNDFNKINSLITDEDDLTDIVEIKDSMISFYVDSTAYRYTKVAQAEDTLSEYRYAKSNSRDNVRSDTEGWDFTDNLVELLKEYYKRNAYTLKSYNYINYNIFEKDFKEAFVTNSKIRDEYIDRYVDINDDNYDDAADEEINSIEKYIEFGNTYHSKMEVKVPIGHFIMYIMKNEIKFIKNNIISVLEDYVDEHGLDNDYQGIYEWHSDPVKYEDMESDIDEYFDEIFDDMGKHERCNEVRDILRDVIDKIFGGNLEYDDEHTHIEILNPVVDCDDEAIEIAYKNKSTGEGYMGKVKVENLASYATNYKLFENWIRFKKNIL